MDKIIEQVIEDAKKKANEIIGSTAAIRDSVAAGRPNSSPKSTVDGAMRAMKIIVNNHTPTGYTRAETK
jgi:hypothetical protein